MMNYESMTDTEIKKLLLDTMRERENFHYILGWLRYSYCHRNSPDIERAVAIKQLQEYNSEVV